MDNQYGDPQYSGIYIRLLADKNREKVMHLDLDNLPGVIYEGTLSISREVPIKITPSGPMKQIYGENRFMAEGDH